MLPPKKKTALRFLTWVGKSAELTPMRSDPSTGAGGPIFFQKRHFVNHAFGERIQRDRQPMWTKALPILAAHFAAFAWSTLLYADATGISIPLTVIQADPHRQGTLLAGTATAQLFRSRDGGDTWNPLPFPGALQTNLHALLIDPDNPGVYLA